LPLLCGTLGGCVALRSPAPGAWGFSPPSPPLPNQALGPCLSLVLFFLLLLGMGLGVARRARRRAEEGRPWDREEAALLRTARDALRYLVKRRLRRLRLVSRGEPLTRRR
jgi:hypothetical protein